LIIFGLFLVYQHRLFKRESAMKTSARNAIRNP
jgi:hypothetical protein